MESMLIASWGADHRPEQVFWAVVGICMQVTNRTGAGGACHRLDVHDCVQEP